MVLKGLRAGGFRLRRSRRRCGWSARCGWRRERRRGRSAGLPSNSAMAWSRSGRWVKQADIDEPVPGAANEETARVKEVEQECVRCAARTRSCGGLLFWRSSTARSADDGVHRFQRERCESDGFAWLHRDGGNTSQRRNRGRPGRSRESCGNSTGRTSSSVALRVLVAGGVVVMCSA